MRRVRDFFKEGVATFQDATVLDYKRFGIELIQLNNKEQIVGDIGKNADRVTLDVLKTSYSYDYQTLESSCYKKGDFFYLWTKPLYNYYHTINDALGCIYYYFQLKEEKPNLQLLINTPNRQLENHPPFVYELLDLLNINYSFTNENEIYENLFYGDNLNTDIYGKRTGFKKEYFPVLTKLIKNALKRKLDVPIYENIYLSRRVKANKKYDQKKLGEDNTIKRALINENEIVEIVSKSGYVEIFGENFSLAEKITMFSKMKKYISVAGAGVTNNFYRRKGITGGISHPRFNFPKYPQDKRHLMYQDFFKFKKTTSIYEATSLVNEKAKKYNVKWQVNKLDKFKNWVENL